MPLNPHPQVGRIYAGAVLCDEDGSVLLQERDVNPHIANSGRITTFGGEAHHDETPRQALQRELMEELRLDMAIVDLIPLCVVDKVEDDGSPTRCFFFCVNDIVRSDLDLQEGRAISCESAETHLANPLLTDTCQTALRQFLLRKRFLAPDGGRKAHIVGFVTDAAHPVNEDVAQWANQTFCLVDGASPRGTTPRLHPVSDAHWIAAIASSRVAASDNDMRPLVELLSSILAEIRADLERVGYPPDEPPPSAAIAVVQIRGGVMAYAALSDVTIAAQVDGGLFVLEDHLSAEREAYLIDLENRDGPEAMQEAVIERRTNYMNRPGGYWVFSNDPTAAEFARCGLVEVARHGRVLLCSDGYARIVSPFDIATWTQLLESNESSMEDRLSQLRKLEDLDLGRQKYPRVSASDDATAVLIEVDG